MRGSFEIGVYCPKTKTNIGTLWRSALQLGAAGIFTIGHRYQRQYSDTLNAPRNIPLRQYSTWEQFRECRPFPLIGVELGHQPLSTFKHPRNAVYLLGAEDDGLLPAIIEECQEGVTSEAMRMESFNVAVAGSIVMYNRLITAQQLLVTMRNGQFAVGTL